MINHVFVVFMICFGNRIGERPSRGELPLFLGICCSFERTQIIETLGDLSRDNDYFNYQIARESLGLVLEKSLIARVCYAMFICLI